MSTNSESSAVIDKMAVHYSSATDMWSTPQDLFDRLDSEFSFTTDVCAVASNAKCKHYFTPEIDGLSQEWLGSCWCNPPYGKEISKWLKKALESKSTAVCLIPVRTDTRWWHAYVQDKAEVRFLNKRLRFSGSKQPAPFASCVVIHRNA